MGQSHQQKTNERFSLAALVVAELNHADEFTIAPAKDKPICVCSAGLVGLGYAGAIYALGQGAPG
jgi:hypothetical protein